METVEQDVMRVLLQALLRKNLITKDIHDRASEQILSTSNWPEFFCFADDDGEEGSRGYTKNSC